MVRQQAEAEFDAPVLAETTLARMFENVAERHADRPAQHYKGGVYERSMAGSAYPAAPEGSYTHLTYAEMRDVVRRLATGFRDLGVRPDDRVALFADTRMEWAQTDFAVQAAGGVVTTVYTGSSPGQVEYLLEDPGATGVVLEGESELATVLGETDVDLDFYVTMDSPGRFSYHDDVYTLGEVYERGDAGFQASIHEAWIEERSVSDLASLVYTSGTTGKPKGVRLTHENFRTNVNQTYRRYGPRPDKDDEACSIGPHTRTVSFLPLAHVFERTAGHFLIFAAGGAVGYAESVDTIRADFQAVEPNAATSVPRVYERMYAAIREQAQESAVKERIFEWAVEVGRAYNRDPDSTWNSLRYSLADSLVFSDVREALGGNIDFLVSGGGTLSPELTELYHGIGLPIYEGYGLTEAAPIVTSNPPTEPKVGTIGPPLGDVDVQVDPEPVSDADFGEDVGELLVKGPNVTDGYWERPGATEDAFTDEGYLRTGDVVRERPDGYFEFEERLKQLIVLSTGKNIPPAPIEESFAAINIVEQVMVLGDDRKFVSALVVPDFEALRWFAESEGVDLPDDREAICDDDRARELIEQEIDRVNGNFEPHERIKKFRLVPEPFTQENGLLTPTMKKKRHTIREEYADAIAGMYGEKEFEQTATTD